VGERTTGGARRSTARSAGTGTWGTDWYALSSAPNPTPAGFKTGKGGRVTNRAARQGRGRIYQPRWVYTTSKTRSRSRGGRDAREAGGRRLRARTMTRRLHAQRRLSRTARARTRSERAAQGVAGTKSVLNDREQQPASILTRSTPSAALGAALDGRNEDPRRGGVAALKTPAPSVRSDAVFAVLPRHRTSGRADPDGGVSPTGTRHELTAFAFRLGLRRFRRFTHGPTSRRRNSSARRPPRITLLCRVTLTPQCSPALARPRARRTHI
jgi:hypothetical protein